MWLAEPIIEGGKGFWHVKAEPHILLRMKRIFERIDKNSFGELTVPDTDEYRRELEWFLIRYPLEISAEDKKNLSQGTKRFKDRILTLENILGEKYKPHSYPMVLPPREYQAQAAEIILRKGALLVADDVGLGKTAIAITTFSESRALPALVVTLAGLLPSQWAEQVKKFMPQLTTHVIKNGPLYELPKTKGRTPDVVIMNYHKLSKWSEVMAAYVKSVVFDEAQELRRTDSNRYNAAKFVAAAANFRTGLSATPIFNLGGEMYNILDLLEPGCLGEYEEFRREWCSDGLNDKKAPAVKNPKAFGTYLREQFLMLRRTREEVKRELPKLSKIPHYIEVDLDALDAVKDEALALAKVIVAKGGIGFEKMRASEQLDWKLRQATGVAKAAQVAEFVKMLVEDGESVLVYAWHREVYTILGDRLSDYNPVMFTGEESTAEKVKSKAAFMAKESKVMLMSLRAGQGLDGLQDVCKTVVFAELDWAAGIMEQCIGRVARDGQKDPVCAYFLLADEGSDPFIAERLGVKVAQLDGIRDPNKSLVEELQGDSNRMKNLAKDYLKRMNVSVEEPEAKEQQA